MAEHSSIEWTDATWNPITGCKVVSPGCTNCYAMRLAGTRLQHHPSRAGLTTPSKAGPVWNGQVRFNEAWLTQPLQWKRPRRIFVCAHGDLFAEGVEDAWLDQVFAVMAMAGQHTFQVLTKRPERMRTYLSDPGMVARVIHEAFRRDCEVGAWMSADHEIAGDPIFPLPNVWLGVSAEDQVRAEERIPTLLKTPAAKRFVSIEPLLGPIDAPRWLAAGRPARSPEGEAFIAPHWYMTSCEYCGLTGSSERFDRISYGDDADVGCPACQRIILAEELPQLDWVIVGGESGAGARPMHPDWARQIRDACAAAGVPFFFKQWGGWGPVDEWNPRLGVHQVAIQADGRRVPDDIAPQDVGGQRFTLMPKHAAGRLLDGAEHNGIPA